jgi:hypothetical protein
MTIDTALPPVSPAIEARHDLENSLTHIFGVAHVILALATADSVEADELSYLGARLLEHEQTAQDAFCRIYKIDDYREQSAAAELPDPTPLADDAAFLAAERELADLHRQKDALDEHESLAEYESLGDRLNDLYELIGNSPPHSLVSVAVKLRRLVSDEGLDDSGAECDFAAVHQIHAFVEKLIAEGAK